MKATNTLSKKAYIIDGDHQVPKVILDKSNNIFEFSGISMPEDAQSFYTPIIEWLELYKNEPSSK